MLTTSVAISSLLQRTATPSSSGERTEHAEFFSIGLIAAQYAPFQPLHSTKSATVEIGRERDIGEAASQHADATFIDHGGDVGRGKGFVHKG